MYNEKTMNGRYYLEITFGDNDWCEAMELILPAIKKNIAHFDGYLDYFTYHYINEFFDGIRNLIVAQLNLICRIDAIHYDYTKDAARIKFAIVPEDKIKTADNLETAYLQLFGSPKEVGNYFIV